MIAYDMHGGLCNCILQIIGMFLYCQKNKIQENIILDKNCKRKFMNDIVNKTYITSTPIIDNIDMFTKLSNFFCDDFVKRIKTLNRYKFNHSLENYGDDILFYGCDFVTKDTILKNLDIINDFFYIPDILNKFKKDYKKYISIHVRRTDFLLTRFKKLDLNKIIDIINRHKKDNIFIFSDDIDWCKNNIKINNVYYPNNRYDYEDIYMMSMSKKIYGTNYSTFYLVSEYFRKSFELL